ncbi:serine/threonine protein kinase [Nocardiopsis aegyptia]|uniref:non-specific serine/threonine protein kinase n=1 Tax=Nocardiopsis aegyptia TaxID=220378 RepID=A0A7Z0EK04_9ACTN|nr:hypothetical protein [Nocardiopsis aegyptia]NYJ33500.1 hypothetical protein [Nocardiopsis aegyptia]
MSTQDTEVGGYRLIREIGRGGFGSVHLAEAPGGGLAAVKLLHADPGTDPRFARMFADEVDAARRISPFCVAQVLDADPHADRPWIASEYVEGRTLAEEITAEGPRTGADLQRLAIVYAASGRHAFSGDRQTAIIKRILIDDPDCSGVPDELRGLVTRCLAKEPEDRPSAHQVLNALLGFSEDGADVDTALARGTTAATKEMRPLAPTRWETRKVSADEPERPSDRGGETRFEEAGRGPAATPSGPASPPYRFAGRLHHSVGELAETMAAEPGTAAAVFDDADERAALAGWIIEDLGDTRIDRSLLRKPPREDVIAVLAFISQARPDLPPVLGEADLSLSGLREVSDGIDDPLDAHSDFDVEIMEIASVFECRAPDHGCARGDGCAEYRALIDDVRRAMAVFEEIRHPYTAWARGPGRGKEKAFDFQIREEVFVHAVLFPEPWRGLVDGDRASLEEEWRAVLPAEPPHDAPLPERVAHSLVIRLLCRVLRDLAARHRKLSARRKRLEVYLPAREKADEVGSEAGFIVRNALAAAVVFGVVGWAGLSSGEDPRIGLAIGSAILAYFVSGGILVAVWDARTKEILKDVTEPYTHVKDQKKKVERAKKAIASLGEEIDALDRAREELPSPARGG